MTPRTKVEARRRGFYDALQAFSDEPTLANFERYRAAGAAYDEARGLRPHPPRTRVREAA